MPTITVRRLGYDTLKTELRPGDKVVVLSCDGCAKQSDGLGGEQGLENLARKLREDGFDVVHRELLPIACSPEQLRGRLDDEAVRALFEEADAIIPLTCRAGEEKAKELLPGLRVITVTKTLGKGSYSPGTGARLTEPLADVELEVDVPGGITLAEAADRLGLFAGSF